MELKKVLKKSTGSKLRRRMDLIFEAYLFHEQDHTNQDDIPSPRDPVWILGKKYSSTEERDLVKKDIRSRLWFSYRKNFVPIGDSGLTSDKGWGCMLRCGQMLLGQALMFLNLGRDWVWSSSCHDRRYLSILKLFEDRRAATYSIHQIALAGESEGKQVGDWFGPNTIAQVLKKLSVYDQHQSVVIHVALDNTIVANDIRRLATRGGEWKPVVLIIPLRLGINEFNPVYTSGFKTCFTFPQSLGVIGGKPNHALYFIGFVGNDAIFLDPHTTQSVSFTGNKESEHEVKSDCTYHCHHASRLDIPSMDPSVAVAFFCKTESDFNSLCKSIRERIMVEKQPLFEIRDERLSLWTPVDERAQEAATALHSGSTRNFDDSDGDFEFLG